LGRKARKRKKPKEPQPFWKKIKNPELKKLAEHIGKITDNTSWKDFLDVGLALGCGYAGYKALERFDIPFQWKLGSAFTGMLGYKLATSAGFGSSIAGVSILGALGLISIPHIPVGETVSEALGSVTGAKPEEIRETAGQLVSWLPEWTQSIYRFFGIIP